MYLLVFLNVFCPSDEPDLVLLDNLVSAGGILPTDLEFNRIKDWVLFEICDILTAHIEEFFDYRKFIRYAVIDQLNGAHFTELNGPKLECVPNHLT